MSGKVINLRQARKARARQAARREAEANAAKAGRTKAARHEAEAATKRGKTHLDGHELERE